MFGRDKYTVIPNVVPYRKLRFDCDIRNDIKICMLRINWLLQQLEELHFKNPYFALDVIKSS